MKRYGLAVLDVENIVRHYSYTVLGWLKRFHEKRSALDPDRYDAAFQRMWASVVTLKPANGGQGKTGQRRWPGTSLFYPADSPGGKFVFVRQLRGPHLST
jgi:hypothetical protein